MLLFCSPSFFTLHVECQKINFLLFFFFYYFLENEKNGHRLVSLIPRHTTKQIGQHEAADIF